MLHYHTITITTYYHTCFLPYITVNYTTNHTVLAIFVSQSENIFYLRSVKKVVERCKMSVQRVFVDMEFTSLNIHSMELISIAVVADDDHYFYGELNDFDESKCSTFVESVVLPSLLFNDKETFHKEVDSSQVITTNPYHITSIKDNKENVAAALDKWLRSLGSNVIQIWGDVLPFDWVLLIDLFGGDALELPEYIYYIPFDIATYLEVKGLNPDINREEFVHASGIPYPEDIKDLPQHNAIRDAFTTYYLHLILENLR